MKKITLLVLVLFVGFFAKAQEIDTVKTVKTVETVEAEGFPRHEVNYNILNTLIVASAEVGYEYFFHFNQSVGAKVLINDRPSYRSSKGSRKFKTNSFRLNYTYYIGEEKPGSEFYFRPFLKYRFGEFEEKKDEVFKKTDMDAFIIGIGAGYVWNFTNNFMVAPFANIGRNFSGDVKDRFSALEFNAGVNIGYRF